MSVGSPLKIGKVMTRGPDMIDNFDCSSFGDSLIDNNHLINLFPVDSTENQKKNVIEKPYYKNSQTVAVLCDTGHDGEYNEREENPLIDYTRNNGEVGMINKIDEILQTLGSNHGGVFRLDNFPKNQEGIKKLETNLIKNMCIECKLPEVTDEIIQHNGLIQLTKKLPDTTFVVETFRKNDNEIINENDTSLQRYSISNQFDCRISKIPPIDDFQINDENLILPNPFPKACSFLLDINKQDVDLVKIIGKTGKIDFNNYHNLIGKINGLIREIRDENKVPESGLVIIHIFNNTVGVQFGQVTANQVSSYVWGYNKRNGGNKDSKNIFTSMVISDRDKSENENERHCIATMGKQMGDLITIHALNTDPERKISNRALLTLDRFCAILNVSMFGSSVFQSPKKIGETESKSVLSYIFKKNEKILELFKINFVKFIKECKEKNLKVYITEKINKYITDNTQQNDELYKNWLIKLINKQNIDNHVLLINKKIDNLNQLCEFLKNGISEAQQNDLKMLIESYRYIDTIDKFIEREKIDLIINETNVKVDNIFTNIGRLSLYITGYSNRAPLEEPDKLIQAFGLILGQISDFSNLLLTYLPYERSVIITNLFISYTIMTITPRKMKQFLIYTLKNITETIKHIDNVPDINDYKSYTGLSLTDSNNDNSIYNSVADNIISNKDENYCTILNERLNNVLVYMRINNNSSPMFKTNYAILRYLLRSIIFQKKINNENIIDVNISNITYDKVLQDYGLMGQIYTNDIYTTPGKRAIIKSLTDQKNYSSSAKKLDLDLDVRSEEGNYTPSATSSATSSATTSPEKIVVKSEVEKNKEISFFGLVQLDFSYIPNFINQCGEYIVKTTNEAITNINDIISNFTDIGVDPTGLLFDRKTGTNNDEQMDIINETNEGVTSFQNVTPPYGVLRQRKKPDTSSDGTGQRKKQNTGSTTNNQQTSYKLTSTVGKSTVTKEKTDGGSSKKQVMTRRKNKKTFKRKTMKKRKIPKRKNKTRRRLRQDK